MSEFHQLIGSKSGITVEQIDPLTDTAWDAGIVTRDDHSIFHRSAWARVLVNTYGHRPFYLRISYDGAECALVPLMEVKSWLTGCRGVSLPFSDFSGPLWIRPEHSRSVYQALLELASGRKWKHLEIRAGGIPPLGAASFRTYQSHQLDLGRGIKAIEKGLHPSVGRAIRKAERGGIAVTVERSAEAMNSFYELHSRTRRRHGLPPQPVGFFRAISKNLIEADLGRIVLAKLGDVPIAGAVFLHSGGNAVYKYGASDTAHWPMRPNHLIMWTAIRHLVESGFKSLHFGRTAATDEGLIRFKLSWGAVSEPLPYFRYNGSGHAWLTEKPQSDESRPMPFRHLPLIINRLAGRLIYPHLD